MRRLWWFPCLFALACGVPPGGGSDGSSNAGDGSSTGDSSSSESGSSGGDGASGSDASTTSGDSGSMGADGSVGVDAQRADSAPGMDAAPRPDVVVMDVRPATDVQPPPPDVSMPPTDVQPPPPDTATAGPAVVDYTARGYYRRTGTTPMYNAGLPSSSYLLLPPGMTRTQLAQLQQDCVNRINQYRAGTLRFTNGTADPGVPRAALNHLMGNDVCSTAQALGDLVVNGGAGGCTGAHTNAFSCPWSGSVGQNTCCLRTGSTYAAIQGQLYACLQSMWDEGQGMPSNATYTTANGHWYNMRNSAFTQVSCGFAFDNRGHVWMNQDFTATRPAAVAQTCSCSAVGASDGCGGVCAAAP